MIGRHEVLTGRNRRPTGTWSVDFQYASRPDGPEDTMGRSYAPESMILPSQGELVAVEVPVAHPQVARLRDCYRASSRSAPFLVLLPVLAGLGALGFGLYRGQRQLRLLVDSRLAPATLDRHDRPGLFEKGVHRLHFAYADHRGLARGVLVKTGLPGRLQRARTLTVAHDDSDPPRAVVLQALPGAPALGEDQVFRDFLGGLDLLLSLVLPAAGIVATLLAAIAYVRAL